LVGRPRASVPEPTGRAALARADLQRAMSRDASVVRDVDGLRRLTDTLSAAPVRAMFTHVDLEDAALTVTARAVAVAALARDESRGCHHRAEYPDATLAEARSIVVRLADDDSAQADAPAGMQSEAIRRSGAIDLVRV
jgi:L-aspartate oxidase